MVDAAGIGIDAVPVEATGGGVFIVAAVVGASIPPGVPAGPVTPVGIGKSEAGGDCKKGKGGGGKAAGGGGGGGGGPPIPPTVIRNFTSSFII